MTGIESQTIDVDGGGSLDCDELKRCFRLLKCEVTPLFYLTECIYQLVLESQLPHKIVNLLFTITIEMNSSAAFASSSAKLLPSHHGGA